MESNRRRAPTFADVALYTLKSYREMERMAFRWPMEVNEEVRMVEGAD